MKVDHSLSRIRLVYVLTTLLLIAIGLYSYNQISKLIVASDEVHHTNEVKFTLRQIAYDVVEAETNKRAFLINDDSIFIDKKTDAIQQLDHDQKKLNDLIQDNPEQLRNLEHLNAAIAEKINSVNDIDIRNPSKNIHKGLETMNAVKVELDKMTAAEELLLQHRTSNYSHFTDISPLIIVLLFISALCILFLTYRRINKSLQVAHSLRERLEEANIKLEKQNEQLARSEERLLRIFDKNPVAMSVGEVGSNKFIYANDLFYAYFGYDPNEVIGKTSEELNLVSPEENARLIPIVLSYLEEGTTLEQLQAMSEQEISQILMTLRQKMFSNGYEVVYTRKDGVQFDALVFFELTNISNKTYAITSYQDITEKKATLTQLEKKNQELEESEGRFMTIFENNPVAMTLGDIATDKVVFVNKLFCEMFGFPQDEVIGRSTEELKLTSEAENNRILPIIMEHLEETRSVEELQNLPPDETAELLIKLRLKMFRNGFEVNYTRKSGENFTALVFYEIIEIGEKKYALTSYQDITETIESGKRLEQKNVELQAINEEILQQKEFNETIVNATVDLIAVFDTELRYTSVNNAVCKLYQKTRDEIIGKKIIDVFPGILETGMYTNLQDALKGERVFNSNYVSMHGGFHYENIFIPLKNLQHQVYGVLALGHDITDRVNAEVSLRALNEELEIKNEALQKSNKELESFNYIASHDLQEPLRKIQTLSGYLVEKELDKLSTSGKNFFSRIQSSAERMQQLIRDLLGYSRIESQEYKFEVTDLNTLVQSVLTDLKEELDQKLATTEVGALFECNVIPFQFRQLLYNLMSNSLKFSKKDVAPNITLKGEKKNGSEFGDTRLIANAEYCHLTLSDNGIGFEPQYNERIFDHFQRLNRKELYEGTGIGLSIVKRIVENHKGIIIATGELNVGAKFDIYIPVA